jgi:outer membrane protein assembly factor BamE (lipoprotein component of BamABCDE complex)
VKANGAIVGTVNFKKAGNFMKIILAIIMVTTLLAPGCVSTGRKIDQAAADSIKKGETTREQVGQMLGAPEMVTKNSNGDTIYIYHYMRATPKASTFIPYIGPFVGGANVQQQSTRITFGPDNVVKDFSTTQGATESDMGFAAGGKPDTPDVELNKRPK